MSADCSGTTPRATRPTTGTKTTTGPLKCGFRPDPAGQLRPKLRLDSERANLRDGLALLFVLVRLAEDARFELARGCPQHAFQACALGH